VRPIALAALMLLSACGPSAPPEPDSGSEGTPRERRADGENREPRIVAVAISPPAPTPEDQISVALEATDADRDDLEIDVEWYVNGLLASSGPSLELGPAPLRRGDEVYAVVRVDDGLAEATQETERITVANRPPRVTGLRVLPPEPTASDNLLAVAEGEDPDGDPVEWSFRWFKNDQPIGDAAGPALAAGSFRRADRIRVEATPRDEQATGFAVSSAALSVQNTPPRITSQPAYELKGTDRYEYTVTAEDPDGDEPLRFELVQAPAGMKIDVVSGLVVWTIPREMRGSQTVEISVTDPQGAAVRQRYQIELAWGEPSREAPPASRGPDASPEAAPSTP
jgi:hypothetical protein